MYKKGKDKVYDPGNTSYRLHHHPCHSDFAE